MKTLVVRCQEPDKPIKSTMTDIKERLDEIKKMNVFLAMHDAGKIGHEMDRHWGIKFFLEYHMRDEQGDTHTVMRYENYSLKKILKQAKIHLKDIQNGIAIGE